MKYKYKAISLIAEALEKNGMLFDVDSTDIFELLYVKIPMADAPEISIVDATFISCGDKDVGFRISSLIKVPQEERLTVCLFCNILNCKWRFFRFCIDDDNNLSVRFDFPAGCSDDCIGEIACELIRRAPGIIGPSYSILKESLTM